MKISKDSWHVKMNSEYGDLYLSEIDGMSLCKYFWFTVWSMIKLLVHVILVILLVFVLIAMTYTFVIYPLIYLFTGLTGYYVDFIDPMTGFCFTIIACVLSLWVGYEVYKDNKIKLYPKYLEFLFKKNKSKSVNKSTKEPNLLFEWIKAKKSKVCPIIEVDGND